MQHPSITKLIGINEIKVLSVDVFDHKIIVHCRLKNKHIRKCRCCGHLKPHKHDHRVQDIRDIPILGKQLILRFSRYRYHCPSCGKKQEVQPHVVAPRKQWTGRLEMKLYEACTSLRSATEIAEAFYLSVTSLFRIMDQINHNEENFLKFYALTNLKAIAVKKNTSPV